VISRHNEIRDELADLASKAIVPSAVRNEPLIHASCPQSRHQNWTKINPQFPATCIRTEVKPEES
jgi:hypothetical protein